MADVAFGFVYDFGPGEEWSARRAARAPARRRAARPGAAASGAAATAGSSSLGIESADPRWIARLDRRLGERAHRLRALGAIAVSLCQVAAARLDGMVSLRTCRAVDAAAGTADRARGRRLRRASPAATSRSPRRSTSARSPVVAARSPETLARARARSRSLTMIDWSSPSAIAHASSPGAGDAPPPHGDLAALATEAEQRVVAYTGLEPARAAAAARGDRAAASGSARNIGSMRRCSTRVLDERRRQARAGSSPRCELGAGVVLTPRSASCSASSPSACSASTSSCCSTSGRGPPAAPAVRAAQPRPAPCRPSAPTSSEFMHLGGAARGHARGPVRAACRGCSPHGRAGARAARRAPSVRIDASRALRLPGRRRPQAARRPRCARRPRLARRERARARDARPHAGDDGGARGPRRARDGRGRRATLLPSLPQLRAALDAAGASRSPPLRGCCSGCSGWR